MKDALVASTGKLAHAQGLAEGKKDTAVLVTVKKLAHTEGVIEGVTLAETAAKDKKENKPNVKS